MKRQLPLVICFMLFSFFSCEDNNTSENKEIIGSSPDITIPLSIYKKLYGVTSDVYIENGYTYINASGLPDHKSPYYLNTQWHISLHVEYDGSNPYVSNFHLNPNRISERSQTYKIPNSPKKSTSTNSTPLGPIGISLNGVPFFNQYAGPSQPLTNEINSFDQYNGHPAPGGAYHYHIEPFWLTTNQGKSALIGFLLDGFPVYGPEENGEIITSSDLDNYHGHFLSTSDFPDGIYHYHTTADDPYINGSGFYGSPGTVSR